MRKIGHQITGFNLSICVFFISLKTFGASIFISLLTAYFTYKGANAPDYLEISWFDKTTLRRKSIIPHRTYTHWLLFWVILFFGAIYLYLHHHTYWIILIGFVLGALLHLLCDIPNPTGIPILFPTRKRFSLNLWRSGQHERCIGFITFVAMLTFLYFYLNNEILLILDNPILFFKNLEL